MARRHSPIQRASQHHLSPTRGTDIAAYDRLRWLCVLMLSTSCLLFIGTATTTRAARLAAAAQRAVLVPCLIAASQPGGVQSSRKLSPGVNGACR